MCHVVYNRHVKGETNNQDHKLRIMVQRALMFTLGTASNVEADETLQHINCQN
jgi:hypothetical protein